MKRTGVWTFGSPLVLIGTLMTSCGAPTSDGLGPSVSAPSSTSPSPDPAVPVTSAASPTTSTPPQETCAAFLPSAPCAVYTSTSGTAGGKDLPWVASGSLRVQLNSVYGDLYLSVRTSCAPISGPVEITGNFMTAGDLAIGAIGCPEASLRSLGCEPGLHRLACTPVLANEGIGTFPEVPGNEYVHHGLAPKPAMLVAFEGFAR